VGSKGKGGLCTLGIVSPLDNLDPLLALGFDYKYSNKLIVKMLNAKLMLKMLMLNAKCTIMNKFRRFLSKISAETCLKMDYFGSIFLK